jgi:hypothetical protein
MLKEFAAQARAAASIQGVSATATE